MKTRITIKKLIAITMAVAAMVVVGSTWAGQSHVVNTFLYSPTFGYVPGQTARISVLRLPILKEGTEPVRVQAYIYDSSGNLVSQTDPVELRPDHFCSFDFNRDDLRVAKDSGLLEKSWQP